MSDAAQVACWLAVLGAGALFCVGLWRVGVSTTYVRDLLHVGAGVWVVGWRWWRSPWPPVAITLAALAAVLLVPRLSPRFAPLARFRSAVSDDDERWSGIALYTLSFAGLTALGFLGAGGGGSGGRGAAGAALLCLSLGDGVGGAIGRRFGRVRFAVPGGKQKSLEGSLTVAALSAVALLLAGWLDVPLAPVTLVTAALLAAVVEALSPRGSDNVLLPAAVYLFLRWAA